MGIDRPDGIAATERSVTSLDGNRKHEVIAGSGDEAFEGSGQLELDDRRGKICLGVDGQGQSRHARKPRQKTGRVGGGQLSHGASSTSSSGDLPSPERISVRWRPADRRSGALVLGDRGPISISACSLNEASTEVLALSEGGSAAGDPGRACD